MRSNPELHKKEVDAVNDWEKDLHIYRLEPAPPKYENYQQFFDLYFAEKDEKYLSWFLHYYENELNTKARGFVNEYAMYGHFVDLKQAFVMGMMEALQRYDISRGVPFLVFKELPAMNAVHTYIRTMRTGYSVQSSYSGEQLATKKSLRDGRCLERFGHY